jgi:hypothetical protein
VNLRAGVSGSSARHPLVQLRVFVRVIVGDGDGLNVLVVATIAVLFGGVANARLILVRLTRLNSLERLPGCSKRARHGSLAWAKYGTA